MAKSSFLFIFLILKEKLILVDQTVDKKKKRMLLFIK